MDKINNPCPIVDVGLASLGYNRAPHIRTRNIRKTRFMDVFFGEWIHLRAYPTIRASLSGPAFVAPKDSSICKSGTLEIIESRLSIVFIIIIYEEIDGNFHNLLYHYIKRLKNYSLGLNYCKQSGRVYNLVEDVFKT